MPKTKIFCDIADIDLIKKFDKKSIVKGFTTNPSLMRKAGAKNYKNYSLKILRVTNKPVSLEVFTDNEKEIKASCADLLSAVKRVSIFSNKATHQIAFRAANNSVTITTEDPEKASKAQETIDIEYDGDSIDVGYNAAYLKDILAHMKSDKIVIKLNTPISAGLFYPTSLKDNVEITMLLMPIRLND